MTTLTQKITRLMTERESLQLKKRYIINNIDKLVLEDRLSVLKVIQAVDRENIKPIATGSAFNLDKAPPGLIDVLEYTISRLLLCKDHEI
jgi:hypothetical protein